ncbi:uncharacterized protein BJ171DRAFT_90505 [Polychytrium aggregatum]|uniref:uncharacterized protein n=1 Tax=Polychytrium aggregatum TaxID=110093 RepID=UPI0022FEDD76|nr:uncharacterized protein BJ171DRAFT_90505 [Polychytrium aggregatum]KAI9204839.1 hypothetical protein BJ171DRAFT_90505 [Polychytrium aggregatum]
MFRCDVESTIAGIVVGASDPSYFQRLCVDRSVARVLARRAVARCCCSLLFIAVHCCSLLFVAAVARCSLPTAPHSSAFSAASAPASALAARVRMRSRQRGRERLKRSGQRGRERAEDPPRAPANARTPSHPACCVGNLSSSAHALALCPCTASRRWIQDKRLLVLRRPVLERPLDARAGRGPAARPSHAVAHADAPTTPARLRFDRKRCQSPQVVLLPWIEQPPWRVRLGFVYGSLQAARTATAGRRKASTIPEGAPVVHQVMHSCVRETGSEAGSGILPIAWEQARRSQSRQRIWERVGSISPITDCSPRLRGLHHRLGLARLGSVRFGSVRFG